MVMEKLIKVLQFDDNYVLVYIVIVVVYECINDFFNVELYYCCVVVLEFFKGVLNNNFGVFFCCIGKLQEVESYFCKVVVDLFYKMLDVVFINVGVCQFKSNDVVVVQEEFCDVLQKNLNNSEVFFQFVKLFFDSGDVFCVCVFLQCFDVFGKLLFDVYWFGYLIEFCLGNMDVV